MTTLIQLIGVFTFEKVRIFYFQIAHLFIGIVLKTKKNYYFTAWGNCCVCYMGKLLLGKLLILLHREIVIEEVAVGEISDWGNCCWGN